MYLFTSYTPEVGDSADQLQYYVPRCGEEYIAYDHIYLPTPEKDFSYNGRIYLVAGAVALSAAQIFFMSVKIISIQQQKSGMTGKLVRKLYESATETGNLPTGQQVL